MGEIDNQQLLDEVDKQYKEMKDIIDGVFAKSFGQMEKLIKEQPGAFDSYKVTAVRKDNHETVTGYLFKSAAFSYVIPDDTYYGYDEDEKEIKMTAYMVMEESIKRYDPREGVPVVGTKINYSYVSGKDKKSSYVIADGYPSDEALGKIMRSLAEGSYFVPERVGMPDLRPENSRGEKGKYHEFDGIEPVYGKATIGMHIDELADKFLSSGKENSFDNICGILGDMASNIERERQTRKNL